VEVMMAKNVKKDEDREIEEMLQNLIDATEIHFEIQDKKFSNAFRRNITSLLKRVAPGNRTEVFVYIKNLVEVIRETCC
jgi:hypothetical protein